MFCTSGTQQAGVASTNGLHHAGLWSGTAGSFVDLNPAGSIESTAYGISETQQSGVARIGVQRASLWTGTADSWVDLHPAAAASSSAWGTSGTQQVGVANVGGSLHASLWSGTKASWVDLNPAGSTMSWAFAVSGSLQAGYAQIGAHKHAGVWSGTAGSWEDLLFVTPGSWADTVAQAVWRDGARIYVAGWGVNLATGRNEALLWTRGLCPSDFNHDGFVTGDDFDTFVSAFAIGDAAADFDQNGFVTGDDFDAFVAAFEAGC